MPITSKTLENLEKFRNREYTANEGIADLATEIRALIENRPALNVAIRQMGLGLTIQGKAESWRIDRPVWNVVDDATREVIPAPEKDIWNELRRRSELDPRAFVLAMARAADVEIPDVLQPAAAWDPDAGPAPKEWAAPENDSRWIRTEFDDPLTEPEVESLFNSYQYCPPEDCLILARNLPDDPDPEDFFSGDRFVPTILAEKFTKAKQPIFDGNTFSRYNPFLGHYVETHDRTVTGELARILGDKATRQRIQDAKFLIESMAFRNPDGMRPNPFLINFANGILDINTGKLTPHTPNQFFKTAIPIDFDQKAICPRWEQFLAEIFPDDLEKARTLQDFSGYCLMPAIFIHKALFLIGPGGNGKSIFINTLSKLVGWHNVSAIEPHQLGDKFIIGTLKDKLLNCCNEIETKSPIHGAALKQVISGDLVQADQKYKSPLTFRPIAKHLFSMNSLPNLTDSTIGMTRRLIVVKFNQRFTGKDEDHSLEAKLEHELPGILNWALAGLRRVVQTNEIFETPKTQADKCAAITLMDPVKLFLEECCVVTPNAAIKRATLFDAFTRFCTASNIRALPKKRFYESITDNLPTIDEYRPHSEARHFRGIDLITDADE